MTALLGAVGRGSLGTVGHDSSAGGTVGHDSCAGGQSDMTPYGQSDMTPLLGDSRT